MANKMLRIFTNTAKFCSMVKDATIKKLNNEDTYTFSNFIFNFILMRQCQSCYSPNYRCRICIKRLQGFHIASYPQSVTVSQCSVLSTQLALLVQDKGSSAPIFQPLLISPSKYYYHNTQVSKSVYGSPSFNFSG